MQRVLTTIVVIVFVGIMLWISAILFFGLLVVGGIAYGLYLARDWLTEKGILNPRPGVPPEEEPRITIEGDFTRVGDEEKE